VVRFVTKDGKTVNFKAKGEKRTHRGGGHTAKKRGHSRARSYARRAYSRARRAIGSHPKTVSLLTAGTILALVFQITALAEAQRNAAYKAIGDMLASVGYKTTVNGATIYTALLVLAVACSMAPNMVGAKVNGFLHKFGLRV